MELKLTPLYQLHVDLKAKMVDFAGWLMPIQYEGLKKEHKAVREDVGMFDVCHMGEILVTGEDSLKYLNSLMTNDVETLTDDKVLYTFLCQEDGGVIDDLLVYRCSEDKYILVVNASNTDVDLEWLTAHLGDYKVHIEDISSATALIALQGPNAQKVLSTMTDVSLENIAPFSFLDNCQVAGYRTLISRTGYTGEDGFEIYVSSEEVDKLWSAFIEKGVTPCGLGARDTLRFEAGLPLYGHEISREINPLEAGLGFFVKLNKRDDFIGKGALQKAKEEGLKKKIVGIELIGKGIPREGYLVYGGEKEIGVVTTGYLSPTLDISIANALIDASHSEIGTEVELEIRGKKIPARVISKRFLKNK